MAQRHVEMLIGRLLTDDAFRASFLQGAVATLLALGDRGVELTPTEIAALVNTDVAVWSDAAERLDSRLRKASLERPCHQQKERNRHV